MTKIDATKIANKLDGRGVRCRAVVETPAGSRSKYDYDPDTGLFELAGVLPGGMAFPHAFGFVPCTVGEDGDPIDILILADEPVPRGTLVTAKLLGVIEATQTEDGETLRNDRVVAKVEQSHTYAGITALADLGDAFVGDLTRFFETYNELKGKRFSVTAIGDAARAVALLRKAAR
jgi:inorganic pyrophosphatase